jgi:hypothetical protein
VLHKKKLTRLLPNLKDMNKSDFTKECKYSNDKERVHTHPQNIKLQIQQSKVVTGLPN